MGLAKELSSKGKHVLSSLLVQLPVVVPGVWLL